MEPCTLARLAGIVHRAENFSESHEFEPGRIPGGLPGIRLAGRNATPRVKKPAGGSQGVLGRSKGRNVWKNTRASLRNGSDGMRKQTRSDRGMLINRRVRPRADSRVSAREANGETRSRNARCKPAMLF
jgi:hypothetical protein